MVWLAVGSPAGAVQDARAWPSTGFRPPFGLGRVTLERPKVTKGLLPHQSAGFASPLRSEPTSDGPPQTVLWPTPSIASAKARFEHPCSRAKSGSSCARPDPIWPLPAAATPSSLMASLTLPLPLGGLKGDQYRAHLWLGCSTRNLGEGIVLYFEGAASRAGCRSGSTSRLPVDGDGVCQIGGTLIFPALDTINPALAGLVSLHLIQSPRRDFIVLDVSIKLCIKELKLVNISLRSKPFSSLIRCSHNLFLSSARITLVIP